MYRPTSLAILALAPLLTATLVPSHGGAQSLPEVPEAQRVKKLPRQQLSGPRFGFTAFTGETADLRDSAGLEGIMTQFGWQFETQIVSMTSGNQALMEWLVLFGGVEQDEFNVSVAWLAGYRLASGLEFGVGPNVSYNASSGERTTSMQVAGGATLPFGDLYVPINVGVGLAEGGPRITTLLGWVVG
jgi:hypothetical protein